MKPKDNDNNNIIIMYVHHKCFPEQRSWKGGKHTTWLQIIYHLPGEVHACKYEVKIRLLPRPKGDLILGACLLYYLHNQWISCGIFSKKNQSVYNTKLMQMLCWKCPKLSGQVNVSLCQKISVIGLYE